MSLNAGACSRLTINTSALQENYRLLRKKVGPACNVAAVVKADAYGLGVEAIVPALEEAGCDFFYVAHLSEAMILRALTEKKIAVLGGLPAGCEKEFKHLGLIPILNTPAEVNRCPPDLPAIWHIDTGMNRLGLDPLVVPDLLKSATAPLFLMTHFSSSDEVDLLPSEQQVVLFDSVAPPSILQSLCNSSAIFREPSWHRAQVRAGMALYGLNPTPEAPNPMSPVVRLDTRILQIRHARAGETVGYNRTCTLPVDMRLATVGIGYADGFHRAGSNRSFLYWNGEACPVLGRVSMDLVVVDIGKIKSSSPNEGDWMEVIGPHQSADQLAASWNTIGYEVLTSLVGGGARAERVIIS